MEINKKRRDIEVMAIFKVQIRPNLDVLTLNQKHLITPKNDLSTSFRFVNLFFHSNQVPNFVFQSMDALVYPILSLTKCKMRESSRSL